MSASAAEPTARQFVYFGTYTGEHSKGIYLAQFDPAGGKISPPELVAETKNPTFLAIDAARRVLFAVNEVGDFGKDKLGAVSAFSIERKTGKLQLLNQQPSGGVGPCHLALDRTGSCVLVANYGSGSVAVLPLESDGHLREPSIAIQHHGSSINHHRQEGPHAHFITCDPSNKFALTCDLGLDKVLVYRLDSANCKLAANEPSGFAIEPGSGPRHLVFSSDTRFVYVLNELSSTLTASAYDATTGALSQIQSVSTLPQNFHDANTCAEVQVHPSGRFLYASNRGHNSIAVFAIEPTTGRVGLIQHQSTQGKTPRHFALDPTAKWLLAENQDSNTIVVFGVDPKTGLLAPNGVTVELGAPVCAVFASIE